MNNSKNNYNYIIKKLLITSLSIIFLVSCESSTRVDRITVISSSEINAVENTTTINHNFETQGQLLRLVLYSITGGVDQSHFSIDQLSGELSFNSPKDFESPSDSNNDNSYEVEISVSDSVNTAEQLVSVSVTDVFDFRIESTDVKTIKFSWTALSEVTFYRLLVNPDGVSGFILEQDNIVGTNQNVLVPVHLTDWPNASYMLEAHNSSGLLNTTAPITIDEVMLNVIGYFKASNSGRNDDFGTAISLSGDGNTLVVGAPGEASSATGINSDQLNNNATDSGAVYVFTLNGNSWSQQAYIKASNADAGDDFGFAVSLSSDGFTLAVGAKGEGSSVVGINQIETNNSISAAGAVYVFRFNGTIWSQEAYIKASNTGSSDLFGEVVSLSNDGLTLAVGASGEDSNAIGINQNETDNSGGGSGAVYVFSFNGVSWGQQAYIKASNSVINADFGTAVSLNLDGNILAVGATGVNSAGGIANSSGETYVFTRSGANWVEQQSFNASNPGAFDHFGNAVSLSSDGLTLAVGSNFEDSNATGVNASGQADNSADGSGAVYVFAFSGGNWSQQAYIKASNTNEDDNFGTAVFLSSDGSTLAVGADSEGSGVRGINNDSSAQLDNNVAQSGSVYLFVRNGSDWAQQAYIKASNTDFSDKFGAAVSLSNDGLTLGVGADFEDSSVTGVNAPGQADNSLSSAGAVYLY